MKSSEAVLDHAAHHHGLIRITEHPNRARTIRRMAAAGTLTRLLPGVYALSTVAQLLEVRARAVNLWDPNAVITGEAAAALALGTTQSVTTIDITRSHWARLPRGYRCHKGRIPIDDRVRDQGITRTSAVWTAVSLAAQDDGETIETVLRTRRISPRDLLTACAGMARTPGQKARSDVVRWSQNAPWSAAERIAHRTLLDARITGWMGNWLICLGGNTWPIDIAFPRLRLAFEIDGFEYHRDRATFEWDAEKANRLTENSWTVMRITWKMLQDPDALLARLRAGIAVATARMKTARH